jgi:hypothetical protein
MKIRPMGAQFFRADGRMNGQAADKRDITNLKVDFRNSLHAPKNWVIRAGLHNTLF